MTARLEVRDLIVTTRAGVRLVGPVDLTLHAGCALTILGETGAGKSLIAQAVLGSLPPGLTARGMVTLDGARIDALSTKARQRLWGRHLSLLPQEPWRALDPIMPSARQVAETHRLVAKIPQSQAEAATEHDFADLGLTGAEGKLPGTLSGGMAQRVAFAATRAGGAPTLMADEPTKGLDLLHRDGVVRMLAATLAGGGALLTITHDVAVARALGGDVMILRGGQIVEHGPAENVLSAPQSDYGRALVMADPANWSPLADTTPGAEVLSADGISVARGGRCLLTGFDLTLHAGERIAITGPSGVGKTSLIDTLAGLRSPASGRVTRGAGVGRFGVQKLYQDPPTAFAPRVSLGTSLHDVARRHALPFKRITSLMDDLNLAEDLLARRPDEVSGGELQRLALARLLALQPAIILADEPTSRLDPVSQQSVMQIIARSVEDTGAALILVTHNTAIAKVWAQRGVEIMKVIN